MIWERFKVKGENAANQGFKAFSTMLSAFPKTKLIYLSALQKLSIRINLNLHCLVELNDGKQFRKTACSSFSAMFWKSLHLRIIQHENVLKMITVVYLTTFFILTTTLGLSITSSFSGSSTGSLDSDGTVIGRGTSVTTEIEYHSNEEFLRFT